MSDNGKSQVEEPESGAIESWQTSQKSTRRRLLRLTAGSGVGLITLSGIASANGTPKGNGSGNGTSEVDVVVREGITANEIVESRSDAHMRNELGNVSGKELDATIEKLQEEEYKSDFNIAAEADWECRTLGIDIDGIPDLNYTVCLGPEPCQLRITGNIWGISETSEFRNCGTYCRTWVFDAFYEVLEVQWCADYGNSQLSVEAEYCHWRPWYGWRCISGSEEAHW